MVLEVFLSYAQQDHVFRSELDTHLSNLKRQEIITSWSDGDIVLGTEWRPQIMTHLNTARLILLLISADFMASEFCYSFEMTRAIERCQANESRVLPIILRPCDWKGAPFADLTVLPAQGKPVTCWSSRDDAYLNVVQGIRQAIDDLVKSVPADKMNAPAQAGNDAQSSFERKEGNPPLPENKIEIGTATAKTIKNIQAETINNSTTGSVNNFFFGQQQPPAIWPEMTKQTASEPSSQEKRKRVASKFVINTGNIQANKIIFNQAEHITLRENDKIGPSSGSRTSKDT